MGFNFRTSLRQLLYMDAADRYKSIKHLKKLIDENLMIDIHGHPFMKVMRAFGQSKKGKTIFFRILAVFLNFSSKNSICLSNFLFL